jgi:hypothetical protein
MQREPGPSYTHHQQKQCGMHGEMPVRFHFAETGLRNKSARSEQSLAKQRILLEP